MPPKYRNNNDVLRSPDEPAAGGSGGGGASGEPASVTYTPEQTAHFNKIVEERVRQTAAKFEPKLKELTDLQTKMKELEDARAQETAAAEKAKEDAKLATMSADERLKHEREKFLKDSKAAQDKYASEASQLKMERQKEADAFTAYVKRGMAQASILPGAVEGSSKYAVEAFLADSEVELGENRELLGVTVKGKRFDTMEEASKHWLLEVAPIFAKAPPGGSGGPRRVGTGGGGAIEGSGDQLFARGLAARGAAR